MVPCPMPGTHHTVHYSEFSGESIRSHRAGTGLQGRCEPLTHCAGPASLTVFLLCSEQGRPEMVAVREVPLSTCIMAPLWVYLSGPFHPVRGIALLLLPPPTIPGLSFPPPEGAIKRGRLDLPRMLCLEPCSGRSKNRQMSGPLLTACEQGSACSGGSLWVSYACNEPIPNSSLSVNLHHPVCQALVAAPAPHSCGQILPPPASASWDSPK